ncbi:MAG: hypothetical protein JWM80_1713 [Cyanobacteria bacterium RYN_339]|nr:hypothetical protein [Cyanobacteria bacterium RYN_339]
MQVQYFLSPAGSLPFNLQQIETRLRLLPGAFRLNQPGDVSYVITASAGMAKYVEAKLKMDPRTSLISQGLVTISPRSIAIYQDAPKEILQQMEDFITWLLKTTPCQVLSDEGEDWTRRYAANPRALFVEEDQWL